MKKLCIDIGGTNTRTAVIDESLKVFEIDIQQTSDPHSTIKKIFSWSENKSFEQINISTCGPINTAKGIYGNLPNLPTWKNFQLLNEIKKYSSKKVVLENDANCAALYEQNVRENIDSLIYITLSTGVGAGLIIKNKLYSGSTDEAMSAHKFILRDGKSVEELCSGTALLTIAQEKGFDIVDTSELFNFSRKKLYADILEIWVEDISSFICNLYAILDIKYFVLGGSVITNNQSYLENINSIIETNGFYLNIDIAHDTRYNALKGAYLIQ